MKRLVRWVSKAGMVLSLILCAATLASRVRSCWADDEVWLSF